MKKNSKKSLIKFTTNQEKAIYSNEQFIRVIAGAGTGKTTIISERILYIIMKLKIDSSSILPITFTKYSARNLKQYLLKKSSKDFLGKINSLKSYTYHGYSYYLLRNYDFENLYSNFTINPRLKNNVKKIFRRKNNFIRYEGYDVNEVCNFIKEQKNSDFSLPHEERLKKIIKVIEYFRSSNEKDKDLYIDYYTIFKLYTEEQIANKFWDFNDLIIYANNILENEKVKNIIHNKVKYLFIDEFQDINWQQYSLVKKICSKNCNLFVVGDPNQCIYEWRGSNPNIIIKYLEKDFVSLKTYFIEKNYRSTNKILKFCNNLIENNYNDTHNHKTSHLFQKLYSDKNYGDKVDFVELNNENESIDFILDEIKKIHSLGKEYNNIAVLYRANYMGMKLEWKLQKNKIPYNIHKGKKFFERIVNIQIVKFLILLSDTNKNIIKDVINIPPKNIGTVFESKINNIKKTHIDISYEEAIEIYLKQKESKKNKKLIKFLKTLKKYRKKINKNVNPGIVLDDFLTAIHFYEYWKKKDGILKTENSNNMLAKKLIEIITEYYRNNPTENILHFVNSTLIDGSGELFTNNGVNLLTIHAAKGLEFDTVFLYMMNYSNNFYKKYNISEERRVYYVGATRAKNMLFFISIDKNFEIVNEIKHLGFEQEYINFSSLKVINSSQSVFDIYNNNEIKDLVKENLDISSNNLLHETIFHPFFGEGYVDKIINKDGNELAEVIFKNNNVITLNINFIKKECKVIKKHD